jgi:hypothetical protein
MFYLPGDSVHDEMEADFQIRQVDNWRLLINDNGTTLGYRLGQGYVKELGDQFPSDGNMMQRALQIKLTGPWLFTAGPP